MNMHTRKAYDSERELYGRKKGTTGVRLRKARLRREPLCRMCAARGITRAASRVDHIAPLSQGGRDVADNVQSLCLTCHAIKTAAEGAHVQGAANHPGWLRRSNIPLVIVCGPPASGKSTYVEQHAEPGDVVIDLDGIMAALRPGYRHWSGALDRELINQAIRVRNAMLGDLRDATAGRAWFIVSAPTRAERDWWQAQLGGSVVLLNPGAEECRRRARARGTERAVAGVDNWFRRSVKPWERGGPYFAKGCNPDGTPLDPSHPWAA